MHGTAELDKNKPTLVFANTADLISRITRAVFLIFQTLLASISPQRCAQETYLP